MFWHYGFFWGFPFYPLLWLLFWVFVVFLMWGRGRRWRGYHHHSHSDKSAEDVLADRFAHGEIDEKEYDERLEVLKKHSKKS
jgi:putative membrane protein